MKVLGAFALATGAVVSATTFAGVDAYQCTTKQSYGLNNSGTLTTDSPESAYIGRRFAVDRNTGRIVADHEMDNGGPFAEVKVVDQGAEHFAFKVVTTKDRLVQVLVIGEHRPGKIKPFVFSDLTIILTGICE